MEDFTNYIKGQLDGETIVTLSIEEIQKDFNIGLKDVLFLLSTMPYNLKLHLDNPGYVIIEDH